MFLIGELLEYEKKHSQVIVVILLGIIITGSISGGLWIKQLNSIIAEKDKLAEQRLIIAGEMHSVDIKSEQLKYQTKNQELISRI